MAPKAKNAEKKILFNKLREIWHELTIADWLSIATELKPDSHWFVAGPHIKGCCPFHEEDSPSFMITPSRGLAKCFGACHKTWFNPVTLVAALMSEKGGRGNIGDAIQYLRKRFGLKAAIPEALYEKVRDHAVHQNYKRIFTEFFGRQLLEAVASYPNLAPVGLDWAQTAVEYLISRHLGEYAPTELRPVEEEGKACVADPHGIWQAIVGSQLLGLFPPINSIMNTFGADSEELKWFKSYFAPYIGAQSGQSFIGFLVFPLHDDPDSVCRFKMRKPSSEEKVLFFVDDPYEAENGGFRGLYGLNHYRTFLGAKTIDDTTMVTDCVVVEGEFDALACIAQQIARQRDDFIVMATGGASVQPLDRLTNFGLRMVHVIQDRDRAGVGETRKILEKTKHEDLSFRVFNWPDEYATWRDPANPDLRIKDPDEAIKYVGYPKWARHVNDTGNYWPVQEWCFHQASVEISQAPVDDIKRRSNIAIEWGRLIRNDQTCNTYCDSIERAFGLDSTLLKRDILSKDEGEEAFITRIANAIKEAFHLIGVQQGENRKRILHLWNKKDRVTEHVVLNDERALETMLARYYGTLYQFIDKTTGIPGFMADGEEVMFSVEMRTKRYRTYVNFAFLQLAEGLPSIDNSVIKAQGLHFIGEHGGELNTYIINGKDVYHLVHAPGRYDVTLLDGPSHNGVIFSTTKTPWIKLEDPIEEMKADIDLVHLYNRARSIVDAGWSFRYQDLDCMFWGAHLMSLTVMSIFNRQAAVMVNAEHESGKSRLISGLLGGASFPRIHIVAHAVTMHGYSAASIRQERNNSSLCLCLEEFEDYGTNDAKSLRTRNVLELFRDLISEKEVNWSIGTLTGEAKTFHLRFPVGVCAIRPLRDAASLSRFVVFELVKDPKRKDPVVALLEKFKDDGISSLRRDLVVGLLRHIPRLRELQAEIEQEYSVAAALPAHASSRFRESLYPALAVMKLVREMGLKAGTPPEALPDYRSFAYDFAESRKDMLARLKTTSENEQIFEAVLSSPISVERDAGHMSAVTSIRNMLVDPNNVGAINKTRMGVYLDVQREWLVVHWLQAQQGVLSQSRFKTEGVNYLKQVSERSPYHVGVDVARQARVLERLTDEIGPCVAYEQVSVFRVDHLLAAARQRREEAMTVVSTPGTTSPALGNASDPSKPETDGVIVV